MNWVIDAQINPKMVFPNLWDTNAIAIQISNATTPDWRKMGLLTVEIAEGNEWFLVDTIPIPFGRSVIPIQYLSYRLTFEPLPQLLLLHPNARIKIAPYTVNTHLEEKIMAASYVPSDRAVGPDSEALVPLSITNVALAAANLNRAEGGYIVNGTNRNLWVRFSATAATAAAPATLVPPNGGNIDIPEGYTGAIQGIWASAGTGNAVVHEFSYQ